MLLLKISKKKKIQKNYINNGEICTQLHFAKNKKFGV